MGQASSFDLIYVDGSHEAADVLCDLTLACQLCKIGGLLVCHDYLWQFGTDLLTTPKIPVDAFVNCYASKIDLMKAQLTKFSSSSKRNDPAVPTMRASTGVWESYAQKQSGRPGGGAGPGGALVAAGGALVFRVLDQLSARIVPRVAEGIEDWW